MYLQGDNMRVCESIADVSFKGELSVNEEKDFLYKIGKLIKGNPYTSRCLMVIVDENYDYKLLENIVRICQVDMWNIKEFVVDSYICSDCHSDEVELEFYLYDVYDRNNDN